MGTDNIRLAMSCYLSKLRDVYTGVYYTVFLLLLMSEIFHNRKLKKKSWCVLHTDLIISPQIFI